MRRDYFASVGTQQAGENAGADERGELSDNPGKLIADGTSEILQNDCLASQKSL